LTNHPHLAPRLKVKVKSLPGAFSTLRPRGPIVFLPQQVPAFISRGATHHTDARDLYQRRRELPPPILPVGLNLQESRWDFLHAAKLGHGTYYFSSPPKEGIVRIFSDARKIQRLRPGLNSRTRVPVASVLTTRLPKPSAPRLRKEYAYTSNPALGLCGLI
jgi:hypothetical protein